MSRSTSEEVSEIGDRVVLNSFQKVNDPILLIDKEVNLVLVSSRFDSPVIK